MKELFKEIFDAVMKKDMPKLKSLKPKAQEILKPFRPKPKDVHEVPIKVARLSKWERAFYNPVSDTIFVKQKYTKNMKVLAEIVEHELTHRNIWISNSDRNTIYMLSIILELVDNDLNTFVNGYAQYYIVRQADKVRKLILNK
jgi:hypothetical protein